MARLAILLLSFVAVASSFKDDIDLQSLTDLINTQGTQLFQRFVSTQGNIFFSPLSTSTAMSMVYYGAREATWREVGFYGMYGILDIIFNSTSNGSLIEVYQRLFQELTSSDEYNLDIANALISQADYPILDEYKGKLVKYYDAYIKEVDFVNENREAVEEINNWVNEKTHGKISKLFNQLSPSTLLVLLNAIYFKGTWQTQFDPEQTKKLPFDNYGAHTVRVPKMKVHSKFPYANYPDKHFQALKLPYKGEHVSMLIVLPHERNGIENLQKRVDMSFVRDVMKDLRKTDVIASIPKFKLEYSRTLKEDFKALGIKTIFNSSADLSGITGKKDLYVSEIMHKAVIEVNEEGSEAAAVTGTVMHKISPLPLFVTVFDVSHPFLFFIVDDRTNLILFMGSVSDL